MNIDRLQTVLARKQLLLSDVERMRVESGKVEKLFTVGNPKTAKGEARGYLTAILHLAPSDSSGVQTCAKATLGCRLACLNTAGRGGLGLDAFGLNSIQRARRRKTYWLHVRRQEFMAQLVHELELLGRKARRLGLKLVVRLNGTSDIRWETVAVVRNGETFANIMLAFPELTFYDYTKVPNRRNLPANYSLTFSLADGNEADARAAIAAGMNVAAVFTSAEIARKSRGRHKVKASLPSTFWGLPVIDGDDSDLRFKDRKVCIVGLRAKGRAVQDTTGFVVNIDNAA